MAPEGFKRKLTAILSADVEATVVSWVKMRKPLSER
jgi:hypothetical protein